MARKKDLFLSIIFVLFSLIHTAKCSKLNVPRVLLPIFNDFSTNFTLEVTEGGCYKWTTSRLDLVELIPLDIDISQECSTRVVVLPVSKEHSRNTAIVLAEDIYTGQVLRCDVIVDIIESLNIVTTTRELFMEEAPEAFEVRAYDNQGNEFTTLEGVEFEWSISSLTNEDTVIRFITFRDSPYETPPAIEYFEDIGKQGHIILLEGVKTGSAKISVKLPHTEYKNLNGIEVSLMVIANLIIEPGDVYILRGDVIHYKIIQVKHGRLEEIELPSSQYYLVVENPDIGKIEKQSGYLTGLEVGKTRVFLHDSNVVDDAGLKLPSASVYVTYPERLHLTLLPNRNWATILGEQHDIAVELYANNDHKIHIGEGVQLKTTVDENYFAVSFHSTNGSYLSGKAIQQGTAKVQTTLVSVISANLGTVNLEPKLTAEAEILIHGEISVSPNEVILPWDPVLKPRYEVNLKALGGDGKFLWTTSNHSIGVVTQSGVVRTHFHGQFDACASMLRNHHNRQCAKFYILPPTKIDIVEFVMENEIGKPIFLNVALFGERPRPGGITIEVPFTRCKELPFNVKTSDNNFYYDEKAEEELVGVSCASIGIVGLTVGTARVTISYKRDGINLEQIVSVSAYRPLKLLHPCSGESVLALGTSRYLVFTGGPRPWGDRPSEHVIKIVSSDPDIVEVEDSTEIFKVPGGSDTYVIKAACKEFGEATVTLTIFNKPTIPKCKHQESSASAKVICAAPEYIVLQPEIKVPDSTSCPMDMTAERVIIQNYQDTDLIVSVKDDQGRRFDNISSLQFKWTVTPPTRATVTIEDGIFDKFLIEDNVPLPNKTYQVVVPEEEIGLVNIEASIVGYKQSVLKENNLRSSRSLTPVSAVISLFLVDDTVVLPNRTSIYNHPLNKQSLSVKQGSGYNSITLSNNDIAEVKYNEGLREIEITPKQPGELQVSLRDLCLQCPPVTITLNIVYVAAIRVQMPDRVEIGKCIPAIVKFYDEFDNLLPLPNLEYLDVRSSLTEKIVLLKIAEKSEDDPWGVGEIRYVMTGIQLGETKVVFSAGRGPREISSLPVNVQVFAPLKIQPKNATLLVGSVLQFSSIGGPHPDTNIEYMIENKDIADLTLNGVLHATHVGSSTITARSVSINPINGKKVTNSKDIVEVHVVPLLGIKLSAPLTRFIQGTTVPVWATGIPEKLSALLIGSVDPPFHFSWGTECNDIVSLTGIFHPYGVRENPLNKISVRVRGVRPGACTLQLNVTVPGTAVGEGNEEVVYTSTIDLEVIENLYLIGPQGFNGKTILMAPFSTLRLNTNKDGLNVLKYSIHGEEQNVDENKRSVAISRHLISVSSSGVITSHGIPGRAMVVITATDDHGLKQTLSLIIQIKPVHYMLLTVKASWMVPPDENVKVVPLGSKFNLVTSYHDDAGTKFSAASCSVNFRTSRQDLVQIKQNCDNTSFTAYTMKEGSTVLKVWTDDCFQAADYVQILSGQVSVPKTDSLTSGDVVCMYCSVTDAAGKHGTWSSETQNVINLNSTSGIGQAIADSPSKAYLKYDLTPEAKIGLEVEPVSEITFVYDNTKVISNAPGKIFKIPILFKDAKNPDKKSNMHLGYQCNNELQINHFPFECIIDFDSCSCHCPVNIKEVFEVFPAFNKDSGLYSCNLKPAIDITVNSSMIQASVILKVISDNGVESQPLKIPFLPSVYVPSQNLVCDSSNTAKLIVTGLPKVLKDVSIEPVDKKLVEVEKIQRESDNSISAVVKVIDFHWKLQELQDPMSVVVRSKLTDQNIKVQILLDSKGAAPFCNAKQMGGSPLGNFMYEYKQTLIILLSMLILLFISFYAYSNYMQPVINVNVASGSDIQCAALRAYRAQQAHAQTHECAAVRAYGAQHQTSFHSQSHECAALKAYEVQQQTSLHSQSPECRCGEQQIQSHEYGVYRQQQAASERTMMLSPQQQAMLNTSQPRPLVCAPTCLNRSLNTSGSPTMRYGPEGLQNRSGASPELRRNRRFL